MTTTTDYDYTPTEFADRLRREFREATYGIPHRDAPSPAMTEGLIRLIVSRAEPTAGNFGRFAAAVEGGLTRERALTMRKWVRVMWKGPRPGICMAGVLSACGAWV